MEAPMILGCDPGFRAFGIALLRLLPDREEVVALRVIRTEKDDKKRNVLAMDDNFRRAQEIAGELELIVQEHPVRIIAAEGMSFPRSSSVAAKIALSWGVLAMLCKMTKLPMVQTSPQRMKKVICGSQKASKEDIESALLVRYGNRIEDLFEGPDGFREHPFDALGASVVALDSEVVRLARQMMGAA